MLSILIPSYNYEVVSLVEELYNQCENCGINFEILVYDDGSNSSLNSKNITINTFRNCSFEAFTFNIGRSQIRNKLAKDAKGTHLLFLDCDVFPQSSTFIQNYLELLSSDVVYGGITHEIIPPKKSYKLRWLFTKKREKNAMCSSNFLINKKIMMENLFDESIEKYGYEDVLFFKNLENKKIKITSIKNAVIHFGNERSCIYLKKIEISLQNLDALINQNKITAKESKIYRYYNLLLKLHLVTIVGWFFKATRNLMLKNFESSYPSLLLFDFYRLGFFCVIKSKE